MRASEFLKLFEKAKQQPVSVSDQKSTPGDPNSDPLYSLKVAIAHKIKELPASQETQNSLEEIEDILSHINLGGRRQATSTDFGSWTDEDVKKAKDLLAKYIVSLDSPVAYKRSMLAQWKEGGLIDTNLLLSGSHTIEEIVKGYTTNPAVKELADDLMQVASLGKGKGEFMLKVLSPIITDPPGGKGDILVKEVGTVEVKTTDGGAGRFYDRQVKAGPNFTSMSDRFIKTYGSYLVAQEPAATPGNVNTPSQPISERPAKNPSVPKKPVALAKTGINIDQLATIYKNLPNELKANFTKDLNDIISEVFQRAPQYAGAVVKAIMDGNAGKAKQLYGVGALNNYMAHKADIGILYINLTAKPTTFTFFTDNASLNAGGLRLQIATAYPVSSGEQNAFPQTSIVATAQTQPGIN